MEGEKCFRKASYSIMRFMASYDMCKGNYLCITGYLELRVSEFEADLMGRYIHTHAALMAESKIGESMRWLEINGIFTPQSVRHLKEFFFFFHFFFSFSFTELKSEKPKSGLLTSCVFPSKDCAYSKLEFGLLSLQVA